MAFDAFITPVTEAEASGRVREVFDEIKARLGVSKVPLLFRIIARLPMYLETSWERYKFAFVKEGYLDRKTKWMLALAISASNNNKPMILESTEMLKKLGTTDKQIAELMAVVDVTNGMNKTMKAAQVNFGD